MSGTSSSTPARTRTGDTSACAAGRCSSRSALTPLASIPRTSPSGPASTRGPHRAQTTAAFRAQLSRGGMAWDWSRSVDTSQPGYYRWTQWILTRLFAAGLMYQAEAPVVWCPSCLTVLAREQTEVAAGEAVCERCSTPVTERQHAPVVPADHRPTPSGSWPVWTTSTGRSGRSASNASGSGDPRAARSTSVTWRCSRPGPRPCRP